MSEMLNLIRQEKDLEQRTRLRKLKALNWEINHNFFHKGLSFKQNYRKAQGTKTWKQGRLLLKDYFMIEGKSICYSCGKEINGSFALHHDFYPKRIFNLLNPLYVKIVHNNRVCHPPGVPKRK